jgi:PAS domain S-box-containing protein
MHWRFTPYLFPVVIAGVISAGLALFAWRRRLRAGIAPFSILMLAVAVWTLGYALELAGADVPTKLFWLNVEYLGIVIVPAAWLTLALQYTGRTKWLTPRLLVLLSIEPLITLVLIWTNALHHLIHAKVGLEISSAFTVLVITRGTWYWINVVYSFLLLLLGTALIVSFIPTLRRSASVYRGQVSALCIAVLVPWVSNAVTDFGLSPLPNLDLTPLAFTVTGIAMAWSLFRFRLLDITPVARHAVVESMSDAVIVLDKYHRITDLNPAAQRLLGHTLSELVGQPATLVTSAWSDQTERFRSATEAHEEIVLTVDGMPHSFDLRILPLSDRRGSLTGRLIVLRNITERKQAEQAVRASEARKGVILETALDAIVSIDQQSRIIEFNPAAEKMFGYKREEVLGQDMAKLLIPASLREQHYRGLAQYLQTGKAQLIGKRVEVTATRADGTEFPVDLALADIPQAGPPVFTAYLRDITERKQAMEALEQARAAAEAANEAKSAFLATMSHEIRTPMNAVIGMTGLLLDTSLSAEQREYAETVRSSSDALLTIINDILDFSKIEAGKLELERQPFDLRECVESALDLLAARATEKGLDLAYLLDEQVPAAVYGDVTRLRQILVNLLSNAVKFTETGEVVLSVARRRDEDGRANHQQPDEESFYELHFAVRDTGIGISEEGKARLFRSFSQVDASTTRGYGGTGLGLAISKRLAEQMGGTMWVESQPGVGTTFHFTILAEAAPTLSPPYLDTSQPQLVGKRILIVDDNATNRLILTLQMQSWDMLPYAYASGQEALAQVQAGVPFDVAILDMQMPEMDGLVLAEQIRHYRDAQALPLVMFASLGRREVDMQGVDIAALMHKPIKLSQLYNALISLFVEHPQPHLPQSEPTELQFDAGLGQRLPLRILLAEDNAVNQKLALRLLEHMGYRADVTANGLEVLEALQRQSYDVILMDVQMPEMDGLEASRAIHEGWTAEQRPRIVAMTANAMQGDREECLAAGMDDYLTKPIQSKALQAALERSGWWAKKRTLPLEEAGEVALPIGDAEREVEAAPALDPAALSELRQFQGEGEPDIVQELAEAFQFETPPLLQALRKAIVEGQPEQLKGAAHNLRGSSNNLGARTMAALSAELEAIGKNGTVEQATELVTHLDQEYQRVCQALAAEIAGVK